MIEDTVRVLCWYRGYPYRVYNFIFFHPEQSGIDYHYSLPSSSRLATRSPYVVGEFSET